MVACALVVIDRTTGGLCTWDIAKGPLVLGNDAHMHPLLVQVVEDAEADKAMVLYFSPNTTLTETIGHCSMRDSDRCEQSPATRIVDLTKTHDEILAQMHQKGRYNIKIAQRDGVSVRAGTMADIDAFYDLLRSTSARDVFTISPKSHYARFLTDLPGSFFLIAEHEGTPVAGYIGVCWNGTGYYYYGASNHAKRALMAPYLLQWEAMKICKERGCTRYDLLGIAPVGSGPEHEWAGISSFKEKFGGSVVEYTQEQQVMIRPMLWRLLKLKRRILG
jgi:lipid II:glycine glycyltransferase (peptidoglycan interpeptide bridge formation enzyme)